MSTTKRQQTRHRRSASSPPPPQSPTSLPTEQPTSTSTMDHQDKEDSASRNKSSDTPSTPMTTTDTASSSDTSNDPFIHEAGPPTAYSILRTQPAFIGKLYKMLEDDTQDLICWSSAGDYFSVYNSALFSKQVLPQYFKHNNWQSFVRQLNMYGFSKINEMIHSNLSFDNQTWDFKHPHFKRGDFRSLILVKRKPVRPAANSGSSNSGGGGGGGGSGSGGGNISSTSSSASPSASPYHSSNFGGRNSSDHSAGLTTNDPSADEEAGIQHRVLQLDAQVHQVSNNVNYLTSEVQDIKSLIHKQQTMIHDLANLVRAYQDSPSSTPSSNTIMPTAEPGQSSSVNETSRRTTSLPSIHSLANNLQTTILNKPLMPSAYSHQQQHSFQPVYNLGNLSSSSVSASSSSSSPSFHPVQQHQYQPSSSSFTNQGYIRRSSHPSGIPGSPDHASNSTTIFPLLNSLSGNNESDQDVNT